VDRSWPGWPGYWPGARTGARPVRPLEGLPVLALDAQATAADPARGALLEIGWAPWSAAEAGELPVNGVTAHIVAPPVGLVVPPAVARLTGLHTAEWVRGIAPALAWEHLRRAAERLAPPPGPVPAVVHFARFEEPFLRELHARHGAGPFPLDLICTHAIARRLFPELPRRTLRALAGYFGAAVPPRRRSADHVVATAFVWRHLVAALAAREGVVDLAELREWLVRPPRRAPRSWPLPPERRRGLPDRPGVYRLLRAGGAVVYVGKAASLRHRVSSHFHARPGGRADERALEMLTQVRDVSCSETETALEAALLEADEIKRLAPPFNVALAAAGRAVWFTTPDLRDLQERPGPNHTVGPLPSPAPFEALASLRTALAAHGPAPLLLRARAVGVDPGYAPAPECFAAGLARFLNEHGSPSNARAFLRLGARLWARRRDATVAGSASDPAVGEESRSEAPRPQAWDEERVTHALEETVVRAAHAVRRGRWLVRLSECSLAWTEGGAERRRLLVFRGGALAVRADLEPGAPVPVPPGHSRTAAERRPAFDVATFDRLRVLTTEVRGLAAAEAAAVELRLGLHARLSRVRLEAVLRWV
jgi:DNA polymerase III subunit epsilon